MKKLILLLVSIITITLLAACADSSENSSDSGDSESASASESGDGEVKTIRAGIGLNENHPEYKGLLKWKEIVEEKTDGALIVETYPSGQLGDDRTMAEGLQLGSLEVTIPSTAPMANFIPELAVFDFPFLFPNSEVADEVLDGPVGQKFLDMFDEQNMKALAYWENGFRNVTNSKHEIKTAADFEGLKLRTMENDLHLEAFRALGANPTPMAFTELFTAMQQGTVDGQENPIATIYLEKFYEAQDYVSTTKHIYSPFVFLMSKEFYDGLTEEQQTIVTEAAKEAGKYQRELIREESAQHLQSLKDEGMTVTEITPEARQEMKEIVQPVIDKYAEEIGKDLVQEVYDAVDEASK